MLRTRLSCAKTYPPLMRQSGDRWHASAPLSESAGRHDGLAFQSCILTKCASGSTAAAAASKQQAAAAAFAVYLEATNRAPHKNFSIRRMCLKTSSATDLTSRSFGLSVGEDGLVDRNLGVNVPLVQQNQSRHLCASRRPGSHGLVGLIVGLVFGN